MIGIDVDITVDKDASSAIQQAQRQRLEDAMDKGFAVSQEHVPEDRGTLRMSGFEPTWTGEGRLIWGYRDNHAMPMETGTDPYLAPFDPLLEWAERQGADSPWGLASYVWRKIAKEGVDAQPYAKPGAEATENWLKSNSFKKYLDREL